MNDSMLAMGIMLAAALSGAAGEFVYVLNGQTYAMEVAPPHEKLPVTNVPEELLVVPGTNDVIGYAFGCHAATGRVDETGCISFSNGLEFELGTQTVQRVFRILAEAHMMMHTPQQPVKEMQAEFPHVEEGIHVMPSMQNVEGEIRFAPQLRLKETGAGADE